MHNEECFPRHLMLGEALPQSGCEPSIYRHQFIPSPIISGQSELMKKAEMLFNRLYYTAVNFIPNVERAGEIKITPSLEKKSELSRRAIPFYYKPSSHSIYIHHVWRYELSKTCRPYLNLCYHSENYPERNTPFYIKDPLNYDIDPYDFFRIEGHIGKNEKEVLSELLKFIKNSNLPFKVIKLKLGTDPSEEDLKLDCRFSDLETAYKTLRSEYLCFLRAAVQFFAELDYKTTGTEELKPGHLNGKVFAELNIPLPGANVTLNPLSGAGPVMPYSTSSDGSFRAQNIKVGRYSLSVNISGFQQYSETVEIESGVTKTFNIILQKSISTPPLGTGDLAIDPGSLSHGSPNNMSDSAEIFRVEGFLGEMVTPSISSRGDFVINTGNLRLAEYSVGNYYLEYANDKTNNIFSFLEKNRKKFADIFGTFDTGEIMSKYYFPMRIIEAIENVTDLLPENIVNFNIERLSENEDKLKLSAQEYRDNINLNLENPEYKRTGRESEVLVYLNDLIWKCYLSQFRAILQIYRNRIKEVYNLTLFKNYAENHPGIEHKAGVNKGGTFIIVSNDTGTVVADFALPYICCSDCPPITFVESQKPVIFKLPKIFFCHDDDSEYLFVTEPGGGVVSGEGVRADTSTGQFLFNPSKTKAGQNKLIYRLNLNDYEIVVNVIKLDPNFTYTLLKPEPGSKSRIVNFNAIPPDADSFEWDFGDGSESSLEKNPTHVYDVTEMQEFDVKLKITGGGCSGSITQKLSISSCTAEFVYKVERIVENIAVVTFKSFMEDADKYYWDFGDGKNSNEADPMHEYDLKEIQQFTVKLKVTKNDCSDEYSDIISISRCSAAFEYKLIEVKENTALFLFVAGTLDADIYQWDFGDNTASVNNPEIRHTYLLKQREQKIKVTLNINKGICKASYSVDLKLPPTEQTEFSLDGDIFCKKDEKPHVFTIGSPEGIVTGPGVKKDQDKYIFIAAMDDVRPGNVKFTYKSPSGSTTELIVRVFDPVADFKVRDIIQPNAETNPNMYQVILLNVSTGAESYLWRINEEMIFT